MCGIVGTYNFQQPVNPVLFDEMRDTMVHRGPDGAGTEILSEGHLALGHRRLSILDLSEAGRQPMKNEDGRVWITFNGEIYNFKTLRKELIGKGHQFISSSDTEVLVHGYEEWGIEELLRRIKGMFAFCIYDQKKKGLIIARDRFGMKPLHYYQDDSRFVFASELKAITRDPEVKKEVRPDAIAEYLIYSYIPHPRTIWKDVHKLPPAHFLTLDISTGKKKLHQYWKPEPGYQKISQQEAIEQTDYLLSRAVSEHLVSDVPVGLFLSGGYDSTAVLKYMRQKGTVVDSFSLGFKGSERSEHHQAAEIADTLGSRHHERLLVYEDDIFPLMEKLVRHYDEPFAVSSQITYHHVAELAAETHKVVLAGDGGDEVFAGYTWYAQLNQHRYGPRGYAKALLGRRSLRNQLLDKYATKQTGVYYYLRNRQWLDKGVRDRMNTIGLSYFSDHFPREASLIKSIQRLDLETFMLDNCLQRADMSSMLHSLEVRVPFLDHEMFEFIYSLRDDAYFDAHRPKKLLFHNLKDAVGPEVLNRKKSGFGFQHRDTLTTSRYSDFLNNGELRKMNILTQDIDLSQLNGEMALHLLFLEQWFRLN